MQVEVINEMILCHRFSCISFCQLIFVSAMRELSLSLLLLESREGKDHFILLVFRLSLSVSPPLIGVPREITYNWIVNSYIFQNSYYITR